MWMKQINRASPEQVFIAVKNEFTGTMPVGHAVHWNFPITEAGTGTGNGYGVTFAVTAATQQPNPLLFAGIVAGSEIPAGNYGVVQVYGYHPGVVVTGNATNSLVFNTNFFTVTNRTAASFTNARLIPVNALGNATGAATDAGYMAVANLPGATYHVTNLGTATSITIPLSPLLGLPHVVPLGNLNNGATIATTSSGSVKAFIKAL